VLVLYLDHGDTTLLRATCKYSNKPSIPNRATCDSCGI